MEFDADRLKNVFKGRVCRIAVRGKSPVKGFAVYAGGDRHLTDVAGLRHVTQGQRNTSWDSFAAAVR
jgi:hypothetical protein